MILSRKCILLVAVLLAGCGYRLAGRGSFLPPHIKTIGIPAFETRVPRAGIAESLTDAVTREFNARGGYRIVTSSDGADAILSGTIEGLITTPIAFDSDGRATRSLLTVTAGVSLQDVAEGTTIYENKAFQFRTELELGQDPATWFNPEAEAIEQIAKQFARSLVATIVEGF